MKNLLIITVAALIFCSCATLSPLKYTPVANVNDEEIFFSDIQQEFESSHSGHMGLLIWKEGFIRFLNKFIDKKLLLQEGYRVGLNEDKDIIKQVQDFKSKQMKDSKLSKDEILKSAQRYEENLILTKLYNENIINNVDITEDEAKKYYDTHTKEFTRPEMVNISQIVVEDENKANEILLELKNGANFARMASKISIDATAKSGGDMGWIGRGRLIPELEAAAFAIKKGELSNIVKTEFGYHIVKLNARKEPQLMDFAYVSETAYAKSLEEKRKKKLDEWLDKLRSKSSIEINYNAIDKNIENLKKEKEAK